MDYKDRKGNVIHNTTAQDRFLDFAYSNLLARAVMKMLAQPEVSKAAGEFLNTYLSTFLIGQFVKQHHIKLSDYERKKYRSYNEFFTRKLRPGKRKIDH